MVRSRSYSSSSSSEDSESRFITRHLEEFVKTNRGKQIAVFDLETSGLPKRIAFGKYYPYTENKYYDSSRIVSLAFTKIRLGCTEDDLERIDVRSFFRKPENFEISKGSFKIHRLSHEFLSANGTGMLDILHSSDIIELFNECDFILSHNVLFDFNILCNEMSRLKIKVPSTWKSKLVCSCKMTEYTSLGELYKSVVDKRAKKLHNAAGDVQALVEVLQRLG
jgi:DNA polymerase III epsilon subunit-like protein